MTGSYKIRHAYELPTRATRGEALGSYPTGARRSGAFSQKSMVSIKLYATGTTTADNVASVICPTTGRLVAVNGVVRVIGSATPDVLFQVSAQSTGQFATNDCRNVIAEFGVGSDATYYNSNTVSAVLPGYPVKAGDKLYLHRSVTGTVTGSTANLTCWII